MKLTAPFFSLEASGSFRSLLTCGRFQGRQWCRATKPHNQTATPKRVAMRACMSFLSPRWATFPQSWRDSWLTTPVGEQVGPQQSYLGYNLNRYRRFLAPAPAYPALPGTAAHSTSVFTATGDIGYVKFDLRFYEPTVGCWGVSLHDVTSGPATPRYDNTVAVVYQVWPDIITFYLNALSPGTYLFVAKPFDIAGRFDPGAAGPRIATVT